MNTMTRDALFGAACALCAIVAAGSAAAQTYPPGTNCQSLLPGLRAACIDQAQQMNSGTTIPNSAGSNTVQSPGSLNSGNTVTPNGTVSPNAVTAPNGTVNGVPVTIIPPANTGTGASGAPGTSGTGTGAGGAGTGN
ncbi:hypothetical protein [Dongia sp.]|uniref:hypothetical protein n=1 Tax=Dongia sp. TaxID=1977262 RepID=UPI003751B617